MKVSYGSDIGLVRDNNQDSVYTFQFSDSSGLFIVADGMGGYEGGELASSSAVKYISDFVKTKYSPDMSDDEIRELLQLSVKDAGHKIYSTAQKKAELSGMGTTVVVCLVSKCKLYTASVGDSRCYLYTGKRLYQITTDHSLVADLVARGLISKEEAMVHPQKNVITRAVGSEGKVSADTFVTDLCIGDIVLICSDGLHTMVDDEKIKSLLADYDENTANKLITEANTNGGRDNITVITIKISDEV